MTYLRDISTFSASDNMGGLLHISIARRSDIINIPDPVQGVVYGNITFKEGRGWTTWQVTSNTPEFSARGRGSQEGDYMDNSIAFVVPKDRPDIRRMFEQAKDDELIALYKDKNGATKLFGTLESPVYFRYSHRTGGASSQRNAYQCELYCDGPDNTYFYNGDIEVAPGGTPPAIVRKANGTILATLGPGQIFTVTSGFSFGFRIE